MKLTFSSNEETRNKIVDTTQRIQEVLLLLLTDNDDLRSRLDKECAERARETADLKERLERECGHLTDKLNMEAQERKADTDSLQDQISTNARNGDSATQQLRDMIEKEKQERKDQVGDLDTYFRGENEARKKNLDDVNSWIGVENAKRQKEAEELRERMEREKRELQEFIDKDNKRMQDKIKAENEERQKQEEEMKKRLQDAKEASENGTIQLYKKMQGENLAREAEIAELRDRLDREKMELAARMDREKEQMRERMEKENQDLRDKLAGESNLLKGNIDQNQNQSTKRINELAEKLAGMVKGGDLAIKDLTARMLKENELLRNLMSQPLSVYFDAYRTEDYDVGGEEYLTFSGIRCNLGGGMDPKSGVFTVPQAGAYMFTIHICTHDMKKGLLSLRCNGNEMASFYDQNHDSNHKNSMAGQSIVADLSVGDRVQVYMYTHTGLMDKKSNWFTHFIGMFLRPKDFMLRSEDDGVDSVTNGH